MSRQGQGDEPRRNQKPGNKEHSYNLSAANASLKKRKKPSQQGGVYAKDFGEGYFYGTFTK